MELTQVQISEILSDYTGSSEGFVTLHSLILNSLMVQERSMFVEEHANEQCNGFWGVDGTATASSSLRIPRSRSGSFCPIILGLVRNESEERARLLNFLYTQGLTTAQTGEAAECVYGRTYSRQQVSYLSNRCREAVQDWLSRRLSSYYLVVYIDATFIATRRDRQVSKETYYTLPAVCEDGSREVPGVVRHPTEGAVCRQQELEALKERGVRETDLVVTNALQGMENAVCAACPCASHQFCVAHLKRQVVNTVSNRDRAEVVKDLSEVFPMEDDAVDSLWGYEHFITFVAKWEKKYPALRKYRSERNTAYFTYMDFPQEVQRLIYTTNWIERLNRSYRRTTKMRTSMQSAQSVIFMLGTVAMQMTEGTYQRKIYQFKYWRKREYKQICKDLKER